MFKCEQCPHTFNQTQSLWTHTQFRHKGLKYSCDECSSKFATLANVKRHKGELHSDDTVKCELCDFTGSKGRLHWHTRSKHMEEKFHCEQCDFTSKTKNGLKLQTWEEEQ